MSVKGRCKKCGEFIESKFRHDYVTCSCGAAMIDGGGEEYVRASIYTEILENESKTK